MPDEVNNNNTGRATMEKTERNQRQKVWQEQDEKLRMIMAHTTSLVAILDKEGIYEYVSPSHEKLLGYTPEELIGRPGFDLIHPEDVDGMLPLLAKGESGDIDRVSGLTYRTLDKNGNVHYLKGNCDSIRDAEGNLKNIIYVGDDISSLRESEIALDKEKEKFRVLVEESPSGILLLDAENRITYINSKFTEIFGYTQKNIATGKDWFQAAFPNLEYREQIALTWKEDLEKARQGDSPSRKYTVSCQDGTEKTILFFFVILESGEQLVICQDITRQDHLEAQFMHSQKMESIGRLASGVAHDFNNLLTTIIGNADFALMDTDKNDPRHELVREIQDAAEKATGLTRQLLAFSRKQSTNPEMLDINEKIRGTEKMLRRLIGEDIELALVLDPDIGLVKADPGQIEQVIMNLAVNARDAMPEGGKLTIETARVALDEDDPISPVELMPGSYVLFSISDTGSGIPREIQEQVFEPFFTTKEKGKGTGLGLSTVYGIIKQNKGNTLIYSESGQGTTVKIFLPEYTQPGAGREEKEDRGDNLHGTETVLLVEDEERVRKLIVMMLGRYGYRVLEAGDGEEARHLFQSYQGSVDVLVTDMIMPGINGLELSRALRNLQPALKVICMSGYTDSSHYKEAQKEGFAFMHKPFTPKKLVNKIRELVDEASG